MDIDTTHVMATPGEVADRDGISKQAVTKIVRQLVEKHELPVERDARDRIVRFSLAHYDHYRGQFASSARTNAVRRSEEPNPAPSSLSHAKDSRDEALRREAWLNVSRAELQRQEELKKLIRADRLREGLTNAGRQIQGIVSRLPNKADDLALAVSKEGAHGLRALLRTIAFEINRNIADELDALALSEPAGDPLISDETEEADT